MKKLLLFDDHLVTRRLNITRRFHQPQWIEDATYVDEITLRSGGYNTACPAQDGGYLLYNMTVLRGNRKVLTLARSEDGIHWQPAKLEHPPFDDCPHAVYPQDDEPHGSGQCVYYDADDPDASRRYKLIDPIHHDPKYICMAYSADGLTWRRENDHRVLPRGSDTRISMFRLPGGRYAVHLRSWTGDRRIFRIESDDCVTWTKPQLVMHPSPLDQPMTQFYGMPAFRCGEIYIGMLWLYHTPFAACDHLKMQGWVGTELCYSYDGLTWNRTHQPFMDRRGWGEYGGGSIYGSSILEIGDELFFYAAASRDEHGDTKSKPDDAPQRATLIGKLKRDRIAGLTTEAGGAGEIHTDAFHLRDNRITLNAAAPRGSIRVAVCDSDCNPLPGYSLDDCEPVTGDGLALEPRWKDHADLTAARQTEWVRFHIEIQRGELFAIEGDFGLHQRSGAPGVDDRIT